MKRRLNLTDLPRKAFVGDERHWWTDDKRTWQRGPWDDEPDKIQFVDAATGIPCLVKRNGLGFLCGYVGVAEGHPWYNKEYDAVGLTGDKPEGYEEDWYVDVHGGLTYSGMCQEGDEAHTICHVPEPGQPDTLYWLGFDCGHCGDLTCIKRPPFTTAYSELIERDTYRDVAYVRAQCAKLAQQAQEVATAHAQD